MSSYTRGRNEVVVGSISLIALTAFVGLFLYSTNRTITGSRTELYVQLPAADGLRKGDAIVFRGVTVGEVRSLTFGGDAVVVRARLTELVPLTRAATAALVATDLFGRQSLVLRAGAADLPLLADGDTLRGVAAQSLTVRMEELGRGAERMLGDTSVDLVRDALQQLRRTGTDVSTLTVALHETVQTNGAALARLTGELSSVVTQLETGVRGERLVRIQENLEVSTTHLEQATARMDTAAAALASVLGKLDRGTGTAGRLINDPAMYEQTVSAIAGLDALLADVKANPKRYLSIKVF